MAKKVRAPKEILVDFEQKMSLHEAATYLETIARKLKEDGQFTLVQGDVEVDIVPTERVELEVKVEKRGTKYEFELELEWDEAKSSPTLEIS